MTDQATETTPPPAPAEPAEGEPTIAKLDEKVDKLADAVRALLDGGGKGSSEPELSDQDRDTASLVREELAKLKQAEDRKARKDAEAGKLADLEGKVKAITEKAPREYKRVTRWMGWTGDDE